MSTKRSIPFEFFRPNEFMFFDTGRLKALEREADKGPISRVIQDPDETIGSIGFILAACRAGLAHHYPNRPGVMEGVLDKYMDDGGNIFDAGFLVSISRALLATGLFGTEIADNAIRNEPIAPTKEESADTAEIKNARKPARK